jgi:kynurenine formamidase
MKWKTFVIGYALAVGLLLFAQRHPDAAPATDFRGVIDLSHTVNASAASRLVAGNAAHTVPILAQNDRSAFAAGAPTPEAFTTHLDAPARLVKGSWTVDQIAAQRLLAPLVVIDIAKKAATNPDYQLSIEDISAWENTHGQIPEGSVVMADTGWDSRWNLADRYRNADQKGVPHFPGFSLDAAQFLVSARQALGLGIDTLSIDSGASHNSSVREYAFTHGLYQLDNVSNLDRTPPAGSLVVVAPMKLSGGSEAPVRLLALVR